MSARRPHRARVPGGALPAGVRESVVALALDGQMTQQEIARRYGLDPTTVSQLAREISHLDAGHVAALRRGLSGLLTVLAAAHGQQSLATVESDPGSSAKSMFAAKLATDALRGAATWGGEPPGVAVLSIVAKLAEGATLSVSMAPTPAEPVPAAPPVVVDVEPDGDEGG